jgi:hypothetical protein
MVEILQEVTASLKADEISRSVAGLARVSGSPSAPSFSQGDDEFGTWSPPYENRCSGTCGSSCAGIPKSRRRIKTGEMILVQDVLTDPLYDSARSELGGGRYLRSTRSAIALPSSEE